MATTVTSKGQVTIPKPVRDRLGIEPGDGVEFELTADGRIVMTKASGAEPGRGPTASRFEALRGRAGAGISTDEIMKLTRGEP